jgi:hypothetical protein
MQYAERLPALPAARTIVVPAVALIIGAAAATGAYALLDDDPSGSQASAPKVIVAEPPAQPGPGVSAKNEAGVAAAIGSPAATSATETKDEAGIAAAVGQSSGATEFRGSRASEFGTSQYRFAQPGTQLDEEALEARRTDPHGPASALP